MKAKIKFTGSFTEYFFTSIGLIILGVLTFGIFLIYYPYWSIKYFFEHMEIDIPEPAFK